MRANLGTGPRLAVVLSGCAVAVAMVLAPTALQGQVYVGAHMTYAVDTFGGATGFGAQIGYDFLGLPVEVVGGGEYFFPDCDIESCNFWGGFLEGHLRLPLPLIRPYALGGLTYRSVDNLKTSEDTIESSSAGGFAAGGGVDLNLLALRVFLDARYEFLSSPLDQWVLRLGLNF